MGQPWTRIITNLNYSFLSAAIMHVRDVLQQINEGIRVTNIETYIMESEKVMDEIRMRNFSDAVQNATTEQSDAENSKFNLC